MNLHRKKIFNQSSREAFDRATILNGNPNGIFNFNRTNHAWAKQIYDNMRARTWFPSQVDISKDKKNYHLLTENDKNKYDLVLAQLIANDSLQTNQLVDKINSYITSPIVNACLTLQASEEANHAYSYAVMAEDICGDTDRIYRLHEEDEELQLKNKAVEDLYGTLYNGDDPSDVDMLLAFVANQILEELVFPGGFISMYSIERQMPGSSSMIQEIHKDETLSHVPLFKNIFRTAIKESFNGVIPTYIVEQSIKMIKAMTDAEIRWTKYTSLNTLGFSEEAIRVAIEAQANSICSNLGMDNIYEEVDNNPLKDLLSTHLKGGEFSSRTAFFEKNVADYSKGSLDLDY